MKKKFDIIIVGGGMVGATLALALSESDYQIALIEAFPYQSQQQPSFDDRSIALSWGSVQILKSLSLWDSFKQFATSINKILVCDRGHFGLHRISAVQREVPYLGQVICNRDCGEVLWSQLKIKQNIQIFCPATVSSLNIGSENKILQLEMDNEQIELSAELIVAADGAQSKVRKMAAISVETSDYDQAAIIANIQTQIPHQGLAIERFTKTGPLALLPLQDRWSMVWMVPKAEQESMVQLTETDFIKKLQPILGYRLGKITKVGERAGYPLQRLKLNNLYNQGVVAVGNAAHSVHPVSGQGFNLGLRDVAWLTELLLGAAWQQISPGSDELLQRYQLKRIADTNRTLAVTDTLARLFANENSLLSLARNLVLSGLSLCPPADHWLSDTAMGLQPPLPKLACGLTLEEIADDYQSC